MFNLIPLPYRVLGAVLILAAIVGAGLHWKHGYDAKQQAIGAAPYMEVIEKQKREAATLLASLTAKAKAEQDARDLKFATLVKDFNDDKQKTNAVLAAERLAHGRLRDKDARRGDGCSGPASPEAKDATGVAGTAGIGEISVRLENLLWTIMSDAEIAIKQCKAVTAYAVELSTK